MVAPCINNIKHFIALLMQTNHKILRLLKYYPSAWCTIHTHNRSKYAAITLTTSITTRTLVPDT